MTSVTVQRKVQSGSVIVGGTKARLHLDHNDLDQLVALAKSAGIPMIESTAVKVEAVQLQRQRKGSALLADSFLFGSAAELPVSRSQTEEIKVKAEDPHRYLVMGKYSMHLEDKDLCGEGSSSICRRGTHLRTGQAVAIKYYKPHEEKDKSSRSRSKSKYEDVVLAKFKRQVQVLQELQQPMNTKSEEGSQRCVATDDEFVQMLDFSANDAGEPAPDRKDGMCYIIMEIADYSLHEYLCTCSEQGLRPQKDMVRSIAKALVEIVCALHARGFAHLDLKPANFMLFNGHIKLIDVDGCVALGSSVSLFDSTLSCSPAYVAPEWARFCSADTKNPMLNISAALDIWSLGMIICELVTLEPVLSSVYKAVAKQHSTERWPIITYKFYQWLGAQEKPLVPQAVYDFDVELAQLLSESFLSCDSNNRKSLQDRHYFNKAPPPSQGAASNEVGSSRGGLGEQMVNQMQNFRLHLWNRKLVMIPQKSAGNSKLPVNAAGQLRAFLWKLNTAGDPASENDWEKREMCLARHGCLTIWSRVEERFVGYYSCKNMSQASLQLLPDSSSCKQWSFVLQLEPAANGTVWEAGVFAAQSEQQRKQWMTELKRLSSAASSGGKVMKTLSAPPASAKGEAKSAGKKVSTRSEKTVAVRRASILSNQSQATE